MEGLVTPELDPSSHLVARSVPVREEAKQPVS
jgi:hypothetical protein